MCYVNITIFIYLSYHNRRDEVIGIPPSGNKNLSSSISFDTELHLNGAEKATYPIISIREGDLQQARILLEMGSNSERQGINSYPRRKPYILWPAFSHEKAWLLNDFSLIVV